MMTAEQQAALRALVEAAEGAQATLVLAPCMCAGDFKCSRCKADKELRDALLEIHRQFPAGGEVQILRPATGYYWSPVLNGWKGSYYGAVAAEAQEFAQAMAEKHPGARWAYTDAEGRLHEITVTAKKEG